MNQYVEYWNIGACGGIGNTVDDINRYAQHHNAEIVSVTYAEGNMVVVFKEKGQSNGCDSTQEAKEKLADGKVPKYCSECGAKMRKEDEGK
jgi:hypothetical protein